MDTTYGYRKTLPDPLQIQLKKEIEEGLSS
jgi:hypothetical protein